MNNNSEFKIAQNISASKSWIVLKEKQSSFGKAVGDTIYSEWFYNGISSCRFYTNRAEFQERRIYANGKVNMEKYSFLNLELMVMFLLNLSKSHYLPKVVDLVVNGMVNRPYSIIQSDRPCFSG
jgi:hypothetical protein